MRSNKISLVLVSSPLVATLTADSSNNQIESNNKSNKADTGGGNDPPNIEMTIQHDSSHVLSMDHNMHVTTNAEKSDVSDTISDSKPMIESGTSNLNLSQADSLTFGISSGIDNNDAESTKISFEGVDFANLEKVKKFFSGFESDGRIDILNVHDAWGDNVYNVAIRKNASRAVLDYLLFKYLDADHITPKQIGYVFQSLDYSNVDQVKAVVLKLQSKHGFSLISTVDSEGKNILHYVKEQCVCNDVTIYMIDSLLDSEQDADDMLSYVFQVLDYSNLDNLREVVGHFEKCGKSLFKMDIDQPEELVARSARPWEHVKFYPTIMQLAIENHADRDVLDFLIDRYFQLDVFCPKRKVIH